MACDRTNQDDQRTVSGLGAAVVAVTAVAGVVAALWWLRKHRSDILDDIDRLMSDCDRAAERMERSFRGHARAS